METAEVAPSGSQPNNEVVGATMDASGADSSATGQPLLQSADVQPLPEQFRQRKKLRRSARLACHLDKLAKVELQLVMQFLDTDSKLKAARCSRQLLQAADHPFAWQGPSVRMRSEDQPQLGPLIRQSLLRHAPISLTLAVNSEVPVAEVAAIPRLRELVVSCVDEPIGFDPQLLALPALQRLQRLRVQCHPPVSTMRLLPTLPALRTLELFELDESADCSWLPGMPALTDLEVTGVDFWRSPQPAADVRRGRGARARARIPAPSTCSAADAVARCAQLQSLRLRYPRFFEADAFARLCSAPALRQLRHLDLQYLRAMVTESVAAAHHSAFSSLAQLQSLSLQAVERVDLLLPQLTHAPAMRTLTFACVPDEPYALRTSVAPAIPSREALHRLLTAAPLLAVRLEVAASTDEWYESGRYRMFFTSEADRQQIGEQWHELRRMGAEMERVTVIDVHEIQSSSC